ncbi:MAG TPA: carboxymuconolactone decarboxylase family protein [Thermomicrobiales bacterium]|nr:carboxymuconolactone decarboxylase family protein [Thermomicrobiales bacterium]
MPGPTYPPNTRELDAWRKELAPGPHEAWSAFSRAVFAEGALSVKAKQLIAVAVAHVTQCPYCIQGHTDAAERAGASPEEIMEAIWVAAEMRSGGAYAHSTLALDRLHEHRHEEREAAD